MKKDFRGWDWSELAEAWNLACCGDGYFYEESPYGYEESPYEYLDTPEWHPLFKDMLIDLGGVKHKIKVEDEDGNITEEFITVRKPVYLDIEEVFKRNFQSFIANFILEKLIVDSMGNSGESKFTKRALIDMRNFLKALIKSEYKKHEEDFVGSVAIWKGLLEINDDFTFVQFFIGLLPCMWA